MNFYDRLLFSCLLIGEQSKMPLVPLFLEFTRNLLYEVHPVTLRGSVQNKDFVIE